MNNAESQKKKILQYMLAGGKITSWYAINSYGCTRLSARIKELKQEGYPVLDRFIHAGKTRIKEYYLAI